MSGVGVQKSTAEAFKWLKYAYDKNYKPARMKLAQMYETGSGVEKNVGEAFKIYKSEAESKNAEAMYDVARFYYAGIATGRDLPEAYKWFALAVDNIESGETREAAIIGRIEVTNNMSRDELARGRQLVATWQAQNPE